MLCVHGIIEAVGAEEGVTGEGGEERGRPGPSCLMQGKVWLWEAGWGSLGVALTTCLLLCCWMLYFTLRCWAKTDVSTESRHVIGEAGQGHKHSPTFQ